MGREINSYNLKKIGRKSNPPCVYDVYDLELIISDGTKEHITLYADAPIDGKTVDPFKDEELKFWFFCERLFGKNGLFEKQGRDDNIYLGTLYKNNKGEYRATRVYFIDDKYTITAQNHFEKFLSKMKASKEKTQVFDVPDKTTGLNYAISDIHGMYGSYLEAVNSLKPEDNLYILGDVIDRGKYGIKILQDIIKRVKDSKNNPKITFLIGNHEYMFFKAINILAQCKGKYDKKTSKSLDLNKVVNLLCEYYDIKISANNLIRAKKQETDISKINNIDKQITRLTQEIERLSKSIEKLDIPPMPDRYVLNNWLCTNKGRNTMLEYLNLPLNEQREIYEFMASSPVILPKRIAGNNFLFVHAMPKCDERLLKNGCTLMQAYKDEELMNTLLQERSNEYLYKKALKAGYMTICGHTPAPNNIIHAPERGFIRIDTACGHRLRGSKLSLYCIERDSVREIPEMEKPRKDPGDSKNEKVAKHRKR